jgi:hypothetical protein
VVAAPARWSVALALRKNTREVALVDKAAELSNLGELQAWADGSSWSKVIPKLEAKGLNVVAVQLSSPRWPTM